MQQFFSLTLSGAVTGGIFALIATGLILSYSATGIFNFSYGAIAYVCGLLYYELNTGLGWPIPAAAGVTVLIAAPLLGLGLNSAVFRPLARSTDAAKVMATVGLLIALPATVRWLLGRGIAAFGWDIPDGTLIQAQSGIWHTPARSWSVAGIRVTSNDVAMLIVTAVASALLFVLLTRTRLGLRMRAVVDRPQLAGLRGIDERRTSNAAWVMGAVLAALAGVAGAPFFGALTPNRYTEFVLIAATAAVLARLTSIPVGIAAGLAIGILKNYVAVYADFARDLQGFENSVPFALMFVGLLLLAHDRSRRGGTASTSTPPDQHLDDLPPWRRAAPWVVASVALVAMTLFVLDDFWLDTVSFGLALSVVFLSFVLVTGYGGMVSLAQATFVTTGGMVAGMLTERFDLPFSGALVIAVLASVVLGALAALPSLRLGGLALALATLALALVGESVLFQWNWLRNGQSGWVLEIPDLGAIDLDEPRNMTVLLMVVVAACLWIVRNVARSSLGRAVFAVRDSEIAAAASGVSLPRAKLTIFCLSAGFAGLGGVLLAAHQGNITNLTFPAATGLLWLATAVLFGVRRPGGAVVAGLVTACTAVWFRTGWVVPSGLPTFLNWEGAGQSWSDVSAMLFGLGAVQLARNDHGALAVIGAANRARRDRRAAKLSSTSAEAAGDRPTPVLPPVADPLVDLEGPTEVQSHPILRLRGIRAGYESTEVLFGANLEVHGGRITTVVGPNGAGKSTLCAVIAGLIHPTSGEMALRGESIAGWSTHRRAQAGVQLAPEGRGIFPGLSVEENLAVSLEDDADRSAIFDRFPALATRRSLPAGSLSGGEQQLLTLAPLLQRPPAVLIADEPSLGLAPRVFTQLLEIFEELRDRGVAIVLVEEKASRVLAVTDELVVFRGGRVVWTGPPDDLAEDRLADLYLGSDLVPSDALSGSAS